MTGENVEIALRCSPALDERGNAIFQEIHHTYKVFYLALRELTRIKIEGDVIVYNDSRIIDEFNGNAKPLDEVSQQWQQFIRRDIIARIKPIVIFRKKPIEFVRTQIRVGDKLFVPVNTADIAQRSEQLEKRKAKNTRTRVIDRFKRKDTDEPR